MADNNLQFSGFVLNNAIQTIKAFTEGVVTGNNIILNDKYQVNASSNTISFSLVFNNVGIAASTDVFLDNTQKANAAKDSVIDFPLDTDQNVDGTFLKISSSASTTALTPVPDKLKVDFIIRGGVKDVLYPLPDYTLNAAGDIVTLTISIFFFHL